MRSFNKLILSAALFAISLGTAAASIGPRVNVHIKDQFNNPVKYVGVVAAVFGMNGPSTDTVFGVTDSSGNALINLADGKSYNLYFSTQGYSPTISDQFNNPAYDPNRYIFASGPTLYFSTFTATKDLTNVGSIVQQFAGATPNRVLFGGVYNMLSQMQGASGITVSSNDGTGFLVVDNVPYAGANTYNIGLYDPTLNRGIGRNVMSFLGNNTQAYPGDSVIPYVGAATLNFVQAVPPTRVETTSTQGGGTSATGASVEGVIMSTDNVTPIPHMGINVKACVGYQWNNWANTDENGRFQLYGLTPGVTYYLNIMGGCTWSQNGQNNKCYQPYSSSQFKAPDICSGVDNVNLDPSGNDIVYVSSDVAYKTIKLKEMPKSIGQIQVYVKSNSGAFIPNSNVNINPDGSPWPTDQFSCSNPNNFSIYASTNFVNSPGFSNTNMQAATGYALLDGLPSGNYMLNVWTPFSSGGNNQGGFNGGPDGQFGYGNMDPFAAHCSGYGVDDYRITIDTMASPSMQIYDSSGTLVPAYIGASSITYIVSAGGNASGEVKGTLRFPGIVDLSNSPISITLFGNCSGMSMSTMTMSNPCPAGNFTALTSSGADHYDYSINVSSGFSYYMNVSAMGWGRINKGGGNNSIDLTSTGTAVVDMDFSQAGSISGTVYKPDGTILTPAENQYIGIDANNSSGWSSTQLQKDGTFALNDVLPGVNRLMLNISGGGPGGTSSFGYALPNPPPSVTVVANTATTLNLNLVKANYVGIFVNMNKLPDNSVVMDGQEPILGYKVIPLPAGTVLKGETISKMLTGGDEEETRINYSPATGPFEYGRCGSNWPGGFCAMPFPSPAVYDFYLMRNGDFAKSTNTLTDAPYPHFTLISSSRNVVIDDAHAVSPVYPGNGVGVSSGVFVNLTPRVPGNPMGMADRGNAVIRSTVVAANFFRETDYNSTGGDFNNFVKYLPVVSLYDANGAFAAAGVVLPPPWYIAKHGQQFQNDYVKGYTQFKALLDGAGGYGYEIRTLAPSTCYTAVLTTPNYPPYQTRVCTGVNGSTTTVPTLNMDTAVGTGATLAGVVTSTTAIKLFGAQVQISGEGVDPRTAVADSSGAYKFEGLPPGTVKVKVSMTGYASAEAEQDLVGSNIYTLNFSSATGLTPAGGSITGTVYSQKMPYAKVQPGAIIVAYDDTYNGNNPSAPLPLIKTMTGADGTYTMDSMIPGDTYKVFLKVPGKYTLNQSVVATTGTVAGVDFTMLAKPLDIEVFIKKGADSFDFTVLNPQDFKSGVITWGAYPYSVGTSTEIFPEKLSSGELHVSIATSLLTPHVTYVLHGVALSYSGKTVVKELMFGTDYKGNADQHIDDAIIGDDSDNGFGRKNNEAGIDQSGGDASALSFPAGAMLPVSSAAIPTCTFKGEDKGSAAVADKVAALGADAFAGDLYTVAVSSVSVNPDKGFDLTLAYDKSTANLNDLAIARYNDATGVWEDVPVVATINPVKGTVKVKLKTLASVLSVKNRVGTQQFSAFNGREYVVRPMASGGGSGSSGTFAVIRPSYAGSGAVGSKVKVFNYPNPFNLKDKAIANAHGASLPGSTYGTVIHVEVPSGNGGPGHVRIYTLSGELVKDLTADFTAGTYNYVIWDGKNKGGQEVANGVYYGVVEMTGKKPALKDATFKMAVIK